jgi:hypothetical protein
MGKKGKKGKGADVKKADDEIPEEFRDLSEKVLRDRIEVFNFRHNKAEKERNYMQLEKDMVNRFYEITRDEVKQISAQLLNKDRLMEMMERDHRVHIRVHEQKVQNLEYEHKNERSKVQLEGEVSIGKELESHSEAIKGMQSEKVKYRMELNEQQLAKNEEVRMFQDGFARNLQKLREDFEQNHQKLQEEYDKQVEDLIAELELRRAVEIHEIEERKNQHINDLLTNHQEAFERIKSYYNDITRDNLQLIRSLKDDILEMRQKEKANQKKMHDLTVHNKNLSQPLQQKEELRAKLTEDLKSYNKDKMALRNLKARSVQLDEKIKECRSEYRAMEERLRKLEKERDELQRKFTKGVKELKRRAEFKNLVLEKQLTEIQTRFDERQQQLKEVLQAAKLEPHIVQSVTAKLEQVFGSKNKLIKELQYHVHQTTKQYNDTIKVYESKLAELGVPLDEIAFEPVPTVTSHMPARLVTKPS